MPMSAPLGSFSGTPTLSITGGGITPTLASFGVTIEPTGKIVPVTPSGFRLFTLQVNEATGLFTGKFGLTGDPATHTFTGAVLPGSQALHGFGVFQGDPATHQTGAVEF